MTEVTRLEQVLEDATEDLAEELATRSRFATAVVGGLGMVIVYSVAGMGWLGTPLEPLYLVTLVVGWFAMGALPLPVWFALGINVPRARRRVRNAARALDRMKDRDGRPYIG